MEGQQQLMLRLAFTSGTPRLHWCQSSGKVLCMCSKHYDELEEEPDEDMRRRTMHLSSADATPERLPSAAKQHRRSSGQVRRLVAAIQHASYALGKICHLSLSPLMSPDIQCLIML